MPNVGNGSTFRHSANGLLYRNCRIFPSYSKDSSLIHFIFTWNTSRLIHASLDVFICVLFVFLERSNKDRCAQWLLYMHASTNFTNLCRFHLAMIFSLSRYLTVLCSNIRECKVRPNNFNFVIKSNLTCESTLLLTYTLACIIF